MITLAEQLQILFAEVRRPNGKKWSIRHVSLSIGRGETTLNPVLTGVVKSPSFEMIRELSNFFGIPLSYFDCTTARDCYEFLARHSGVSSKHILDAPYGPQTKIRLRLAHLDDLDPVFAAHVVNIIDRYMNLSAKVDAQSSTPESD